jgi:hypothetical protein
VASTDDDPVDPFIVFGLDRTASLDELRAARRRLAFDLHPDRGATTGAGSDPAAMQRINAAFERCVAHLTGRRPLAPPAAAPAPPSPSPQPSPTRRRTGRRYVDHDAPSFTVDALPAETFEALLLVAADLGDLVDDDPPYRLECRLAEPIPCWCRLDVVPDAGGSTVSITVVGELDDAGTDPFEQLVTAEAVRDVWVAELNRLGRPTP